VENNVTARPSPSTASGWPATSECFAYLQVGVKIGAGIVVDGQLLHGAHGAAGEVSMMPYPGMKTETPRRAGLEHYPDPRR